MASAAPGNEAYLFPSSFAGPLGAFRQSAIAQTLYTLDYTQWLAGQETLAAVNYYVTPATVPALAVTNSLIGASGAIPAGSISFVISGGISGIRYTLSVVAATTNGQTKTDTIILQVVSIDGNIEIIPPPQMALPSVLHAGVGAPSPALGLTGDYYLDVASNTLYGPMSAGAWPNTGGNFGGGNFIAGVTNGQPPSNALGSNGQWFLDTVTGAFYGPKANGLWPAIGLNVKVTQVQPYKSIGANATLTAADLGSFIEVSANVTIQLPSPVGITGAITFWPWQSACTLVTPLGFFVGPNVIQATPNILVVPSKYIVTLYADGTNWVAAMVTPDLTEFAGIYSPNFTGTPTAITAARGDNTTKLATTAFTQDAITSSATSGSMQLQGNWNAAINSPALLSSIGTKGFFYKVSVAGSTSLNGLTQWNVGDVVYFGGNVWNKINGLAFEVLSVAGRTGDIVIVGNDISDASTIGRTVLSSVSAQAAQNALGIDTPTTVSTNLALNASQIGGFFNVVAAVSISIPDPSTIQGSYVFYANGATFTITTPANRIIGPSASGTGSLVIPSNRTIRLTSNGSDWVVSTETVNLTLFAPLASPTFQGAPTTPTPATNDYSIQVANTQFVGNQISAFAGATSLAGAIAGLPNFSLGTYIIANSNTITAAGAAVAGSTLTIYGQNGGAQATTSGTWNLLGTVVGTTGFCSLYKRTAL